MIPSPRNASRFQQLHNPLVADMARLHRLGRAYSHEGVIDSETSLGNIEIYEDLMYDDGK
jgi:hypothetical protein